MSLLLSIKESDSKQTQIVKQKRGKYLDADEFDPRMSLAQYIREVAGLTGTKVLGCHHFKFQPKVVFTQCDGKVV